MIVNGIEVVLGCAPVEAGIRFLRVFDGMTESEEGRPAGRAEDLPRDVLVSEPVAEVI